MMVGLRALFATRQLRSSTSPDKQELCGSNKLSKLFNWRNFTQLWQQSGNTPSLVGGKS